jgi:hypothetical protein
LTSGLKTYLNTKRAIASADVQFGKRVRVRTMPNGCTYFSNRLYDKALFFSR